MDKLFCYLVDFGAVTAGVAYNKPLDFATDSDFVIRAIRSNLSDTTEATVTIKKDTGDDMSNSAFELRAIAGANNAVNIFDNLVVPRGSKWTVTANCSAGIAQPLQLQFWGVKK